ncbi:MAG: IS21 family transposase [Clostridia bacterium]|nr:IS21 family transposase [Clostridia bacterium]
MYQKIQHFKRKGFSKADIIRETGLNKRTVLKYYSMSEKKYSRYIEKVRYRTKVFEPYQPPILNLYKVNDFQRLEKSAVYDYLEEKLGSLPGTERSFRNYISYLVETEQLKFNGNKRIYSPVAELPYGRQLQIDFGEYCTRRGLKLYIFAAVLSASRYKYCALQDKPFTTLDLINHLLDCFCYLGGMPEELVIDQDKVMVASENRGDIIYTRDFKQFIEEMDLKMYVCRKSDPESKGKIENVIKFIKRNFLSIRDFENIKEAQERLSRWLNRRANGKISLATRRIPQEMFTEEKVHLRALSNSIYQKDSSNARERRKADIMGQISVNSGKYPVPLEYREREVDIYKTAEKLFIYDIRTGEKIAEYAISPIPGSRIANRARYQHKEYSQRQLKEKLKRLFALDSWSEFVDKNFRMYTRYFRDQYHDALKKFSQEIENEHLRQALDLCLENQTYTMANLYDTYQYYRQEAELALPKVKIVSKLRGIPREKKAFQVEKRDIEVYHTLVNASSEVGP